MMLGAAPADAVSHNHLTGTATRRITFDATGPLRHLSPGQLGALFEGLDWKRVHSRRVPRPQLAQ